MSAIDKARIIVVGDSGVGKTSLVHLLAHNEPLTSPGWTVGCAVEVILHEYKETTKPPNSFFIELWDIGGSEGHKNARGVFYQPTHGIILVHDLSNRKSHVNLHKWLVEILNKDSKDIRSSEYDMDPEQFLGSTQIPILVIGTKLDLVIEKNKIVNQIDSIAHKCGTDEILLNAHNTTAIGTGTSNAVKLGRFFDKVIEKKYYKDITGISDKRKFASQYTTTTSPNINPYTSPFSSFNTTYNELNE